MYISISIRFVLTPSPFLQVSLDVCNTDVHGNYKLFLIAREEHCPLQSPS